MAEKKIVDLDTTNEVANIDRVLVCQSGQPVWVSAEKFLTHNDVELNELNEKIDTVLNDVSGMIVLIDESGVLD